MLKLSLFESFCLTVDGSGPRSGSVQIITDPDPKNIRIRKTAQNMKKTCLLNLPSLLLIRIKKGTKRKKKFRTFLRAESGCSIKKEMLPTRNVTTVPTWENSFHHSHYRYGSVY